MLYPQGVMALRFLVDSLLLMGTNRLCGYPAQPGRALIAAALGGVYAGACCTQRFYFLGNSVWRAFSLVCISLVAFGLCKSAVRKCIVFLLLTMTLSGIALGLGGGSVGSTIFAACVLFGLCLHGFGGGIGTSSYVPVELCYKNKHIYLTALQDTGNMLRDPVTGRPVLVVGAETAQLLTGLSKQQLEKPVESLSALPGLRLVPYRTVGKDSALMLALKIPQVTIGKWKGSSLVAFAPEGLSMQGEYQALTGGTV